MTPRLPLMTLRPRTRRTHGQQTRPLPRRVHGVSGGTASAPVRPRRGFLRHGRALLRLLIRDGGQ